MEMQMFFVNLQPAYFNIDWALASRYARLPSNATLKSLVITMTVVDLARTRKSWTPSFFRGWGSAGATLTSSLMGMLVGET